MPFFRVARVAMAVLLPAAVANPFQPAWAQAAAAPPKCDAAEHRQFDFWVGDWNVTTAGHQAGTNLITLEESGCVVHEHWTGAKGLTGQSFNFWDRLDRKWHQVWVDSAGNTLDLAGVFAGGTLTFYGEKRQADGTTLKHRLSFHANADGTVRQLWETSTDAGKTWTVAFDGLYKKKG